MTGLEVQCRWMAAQDGSEQQLELGKDVLSPPPSSTFFLKGLCLMLWKTMIERLT